MSSPRFFEDIISSYIDDKIEEWEPFLTKLYFNKIARFLAVLLFLVIVVVLCVGIYQIAHYKKTTPNWRRGVTKPMTRPPSESTMSKTLPSIANDGDYREYMEKIMKVEQEADELLNLLNSQLKGRLRKDEDAQTFKNLITDQTRSFLSYVQSVSKKGDYGNKVIKK